jgi:hypothetical protein
VVALFLATAIVLFLRESWLPAALTTLGTLLTGGAATWLTTQRAAIRDEEQRAFEELVRVCTPAADDERRTAAPERAITDEPWFRELERAAANSAFTSGPAQDFLASLRRAGR